MNPITQMQNHFTSIITTATQEIKNLKIIITDKEECIRTLKAENVKLMQDLTETQKALADRISLLNTLLIALGLARTDSPQNAIQKINSLMAELKRKNEHLRALEKEINDYRKKMDELEKKITFLNSLATGVISATMLGFISYKFTKIISGVKAGAVSGAAIGLIIGAPGGPLAIGSSTSGATLGGIIGGLVGLVSP